MFGLVLIARELTALLSSGLFLFDQYREGAITFFSWWEAAELFISKVGKTQPGTVENAFSLKRPQILIGGLLLNSECYRRVELLRNRQDMMKEKFKEAMVLRATQEEEDEAIGSEDEEELQDLLSQDWRVKGALLQRFCNMADTLFIMMLLPLLEVKCFC